MEALFRDYWWLLFPFFGMFFVVFGMINDNRRGREIMGMIKTYVDQGKDPPPELMRALTKTMEDSDAELASMGSASPPQRGWTFLIFLAVGAGAGVAYYFEQHYIFLAVAVAMGVLAVGALIMLLIGRGKS